MSAPAHRAPSATVTTAVIPAAGLGTRLLPATRAVPKELLPVVDRPAIQYVVEEAEAAGIDHIVIVISPAKAAIEDHFRQWRSPAGPNRRAAISFVQQTVPRGLGDAVAMAASEVGERPFVVLLPDRLMANGAEVLDSLVAGHHERGTAVVALRKVPPGEITRYGCAEVADRRQPTVRVKALVEKPAVHEAPSDLAVMGRYLLLPSVFDALDRARPDAAGEVQLTAALADLADRGGLHGRIVDDPCFDVGDRLGLLCAALELGLEHPEVGPGLSRALVDLMTDRGLASNGAPGVAGRQ